MHIWQARFWRRALSPYSIYRHYPVLHAVRVGLAYLLTVVLTLGFDIPHGEWMSITVLIVMGSLPHLGSIFKKARQRAIGTAAGALAGILMLLALVLALLGVAGKYLAGYAGGRGLRASVIGWGMVPRGEVGLIFVAVGSQLRLDGHPLLTPELQAGIVGAILLTTILGPVGLSLVLNRR